MHALRRLAFHTELFAKGVLFGCRGCGQCVLRRTAFICPMQCPKGMRNGPCGGTDGARCEVHPGRACVWARIERRRHGDRLVEPPTLPALDHALVGTASLANALTGRDAGCRAPLPPVERRPAASALARALRAGRTVITSEVRAPRDAAWARLDREAAALAGVCDAVNATSFLNGQAALPSALVAARLAASGIEAVVQLTGRDHTRATAAGEALAARAQGVGNALCLTGDWGVRAPALAQPVFALDAALLVRELAALDGEPLCLGVAANPDAEPVVLQVRRLMQKAAAGATFVQTQVVTDAVRLARFTDAYAAAGLDRRLALVVGIPVVLSPGAQAHLGRLPGVRLDPGFAAALAAARDPVDAGIAAALSLARQALALPGVRGVHLMRFGGTPAAVADTARALRAGIPQTISQEYPCPSPA